jgi:hypothetical protein
MKTCLPIILILFSSINLFSQKDIFHPKPIGEPLRAYILESESKDSVKLVVNDDGRIIKTLPLSDPIFVTITGEKHNNFIVSEAYTLFTSCILPMSGAIIKKKYFKTMFRPAGEDQILVYKNEDSALPYTRFEFEGVEAQIVKIGRERVKVEIVTPAGKKLKGWVKREQLCGNPLTTCP